MADYENDEKLQLAVEKLLEIIGEASRRVSEDCRSRHSHIPWAGMIGLRNVLAHEYGEIRVDLIWRVVTLRIPILIAEIETILTEI
ncbi:MAG: DUF86 domain-containing protein [Candidatus Hydrogenedentes bacterium]|nr:DUF86 domain-containing protein [Candidatus Hydrogenedentota bacterium]